MEFRGVGVIESLQQADHMGQTSQDDHYMKDLMATTKDVECAGMTYFRELTAWISKDCRNVNQEHVLV